MPDELTSATFAALTERQRDVLARVAIGDDSFIPTRTGDALVKRGLIECYVDEQWGDRFRFRIRRYRMPIAVHIAWCECCAETVEE